MWRPLYSLDWSASTQLPGPSAGKVKDLRTRSPETYWVRFPDDTEKYWFPASDVRSWVVEEAEDGKDDKPESSKAAGKKRQAEEGGSPQKASPQKKEKVSGGAANLHILCFF